MRKVKKVRPYSCVGYNQDYDSKKSKFAVRDKLMSLSSYEDENGVFHLLNDISLLFNQQRIENRISPRSCVKCLTAILQINRDI